MEMETKLAVMLFNEEEIKYARNVCLFYWWRVWTRETISTRDWSRNTKSIVNPFIEEEMKSVYFF